ncbi:hypothetical protein AP3564_04815 [Aeribacillus pallidus]|uniref:Uncharacterized protein n=1 Tax=Aeribacillus pallidus TaxID=33936 RepID=A0A223E337_9BACI|nr:hypothetical protein AP3564_04815 [Aeribacillus pallidus]
MFHKLFSFVGGNARNSSFFQKNKILSYFPENNLLLSNILSKSFAKFFSNKKGLFRKSKSTENKTS